MAGLLSVFAAFDTKSCGNLCALALRMPGRTESGLGTLQPLLSARRNRKLHRIGISKAEIARRLKYRPHLRAVHSDRNAMKRPNAKILFERTGFTRGSYRHSYGSEEKAMSWYYHLKGKLSFPC
jgi:hypothetical protein